MRQCEEHHMIGDGHLVSSKSAHPRFMRYLVLVYHQQSLLAQTRTRNTSRSCRTWWRRCMRSISIPCICWDTAWAATTSSTSSTTSLRPGRTSTSGASFPWELHGVVLLKHSEYWPQVSYYPVCTGLPIKGKIGGLSLAR